MSTFTNCYLSRLLNPLIFALRPGVSLAVLLAAGGCGGAGKALPRTQAGPAPATAAQPVAEPPGQFALPALDSLAQVAPATVPRVAAGTTSTWQYAGYYDEPTGSDNLSVEDVLRLVFAPQFDPQGDPPSSEAAYARYTFTGLADYGGPGQVILEWTVPPPEGSVWVALPNFESDHWEWFQLDSGPLSTLDLESFEPYRAPETQFAFVYVLLTGIQPATLEYVVMGQPPEAHLFIESNLGGIPPNGDAPLQVNFQLYPDTPGSLVTGYDVDWEGDGEYDFFDWQEDTLSKLFFPGTYSTTVTMHTSDGQSVTASYDFVAKNPGNNPPTAVLAEIPDGEGLYPVTLDASASSDGVQIIDYEWDVDDDSEVDVITTIPTLPYVFCRSGTQTVSVTVRDNDLATDTASQSFTLSHALNKTTLSYDLAFAPQFSLALSNLGSPDTRAGVAWFDTDARVLHFRQALTDNGDTWGGINEPAGGTVDDGWGVSLAATLVPGQKWPMLAYGSGEFDTNRVVRFRHATDLNGSSWSDEVAVCDVPYTGTANRLLNVNGKPALITGYQYGYSNNWEFYYLAAADTAGGSWGAEQSMSGTMDGALNDFQVLPNGSHVLLGFLQDFGFDVYGDEVDYAFADYDPVAKSYNELYRCDLPHTYDLALGRLVDSNFAVLARRNSQGSQGWWVTSNGVLGTDWDEPAELTPAGYGGSGAFVIYDGKPLLVYHNWDHGLTLRFANDAAGLSWSLPALVAPDASWRALPQAVIVNGEPLIVYYDTNQQLVALYKEP